MNSIFTRLGLAAEPLMLAPLAGVSDHPFRRVCASLGADLTFVEMISATALNFGSAKTLTMLKRHPSETVLAVQLTGRSAEDVARAVERLAGFEAIDINMGCPVAKIVKTGCGSAILKDPERIFQTLRLAREATDRPVSAKVRLGWDRASINIDEIAAAVSEGGAAWLTIHGRTRADDYGVPVDLEAIARTKARVSLPVIGNGNLFCRADADLMRARTRVDGLMVSRGALGNPWVFREIKTGRSEVGLEEWRDVVLSHLRWQEEEYGGAPGGAVCMRKHLLWYTKGWPGGKKVREAIVATATLSEARRLIEEFAEELARAGVMQRAPVATDSDGRFAWDPKWEMDRKLDRGVGDDGLGSLEAQEA